MAFDFDAPPERRGTDSLKWCRYADRDVLPLWVADMDFASPPAVVDALQSRVAHGVFGYPEAAVVLEGAVLDHLERDFGWRADPAWLVWLPGLVSGIAVACRACAAPGESVVTHTPVYPPFLKVPAVMDREVVAVPLIRGDERWEIDWEHTGRALAAGAARLFLLCSPHNPCGRVWSDDELGRLAELCLAHDVVLCSDEIHNQLVLDATLRHRVTASLGTEIGSRCITLMAPSKAYNIAGLGCSFAVIPEAGLRRRFRRAMAGIVPGVNVLGLVAAAAAYRGGEPWRRALIDYLRRGRDILQDAVTLLPGLNMTPVEATYLAWLDARDLGIADPATHFEAHGLGFSDGRDFGSPGFVRWNFGCSHTTLHEAVARLRRAVDAAAD